MTNVGKNLLWGVRQGLITGTVFCAIGLVALVLGPDRARADARASAYQVVTIYFGMGAVVGLLLGLARPWLRHRGVAIGIGVISGVVLLLLVGVLTKGVAVLGNRALWNLAVGLGGPFGAAYGYMEWRRNSGPSAI